MQALLGVTPHENFADQGYAYVIATFGVPICLLLWFSFWFLSMSDERGQRFRAFASIYITLILCVSGFSLFALKTSGLLWFLVGCSLKNPAPLFQPMGTRKPTAAPYKLTAAFYKPTVLPSKLTPLKPTTASTPIKAFTSGPVPPAMSAKTESFTSRKHVD